jgi:putative hydrolase
VAGDLPAGELERRTGQGTLRELPGIGPATAEVIVQAAAGQQPAYLARLLAEAQQPPRTSLRTALLGDCHTHSDGQTAAARRPRWPRQPATWVTSGSR